MKRILALLLTAGLLLAALWIGRKATSNSAPTPPTDDSPEACVERMFLAAEQGAVGDYLDCFTGPQRERLERERREQSDAQFAESLQSAVRQLKGRAIHAAAASNNRAATDDRAELRVERIYSGRHEQQIYLLLREKGRWRVSEIREAAAFQPPVPYGTPVY